MTLDAEATQKRYNNAVKARKALAESYHQAKVGREFCCAAAVEMVNLATALLRQAEDIQSHEAAYCCDETEQAKERARQQKDVARAMGKEKAEGGRP